MSFLYSAADNNYFQVNLPENDDSDDREYYYDQVNNKIYAVKKGEIGLINTQINNSTSEPSNLTQNQPKLQEQQQPPIPRPRHDIETIDENFIDRIKYSQSFERALHQKKLQSLKINKNQKNFIESRMISDAPFQARDEESKESPRRKALPPLHQPPALPVQQISSYQPRKMSFTVRQTPQIEDNPDPNWKIMKTSVPKTYSSLYKSKVMTKSNNSTLLNKNQSSYSQMNMERNASKLRLNRNDNNNFYQSRLQNYQRNYENEQEEDQEAYDREMSVNKSNREVDYVEQVFNRNSTSRKSVEIQTETNMMVPFELPALAQPQPPPAAASHTQSKQPIVIRSLDERGSENYYIVVDGNNPTVSFEKPVQPIIIKPKSLYKQPPVQSVNNNEIDAKNEDDDQKKRIPVLEGAFEKEAGEKINYIEPLRLEDVLTPRDDEMQDNHVQIGNLPHDFSSLDENELRKAVEKNRAINRIVKQEQLENLKKIQGKAFHQYYDNVNLKFF
jgi:hypothetical protein